VWLVRVARGTRRTVAEGPEAPIGPRSECPEIMPKHVKMRCPFLNSEGHEEIETLWAIPRDNGYEIDNIPFYVTDPALKDVVTATVEIDGGLRIAQLLVASGHSTIQILFGDAQAVPAMRSRLREMGCESELSDIPRLVAVDVPPSVDYLSLKRLLDELEVDGVLEYQEACLGFAHTEKQ